MTKRMKDMADEPNNPTKPKLNWKHYLAGVLMAASIVATWVAAKVSGQEDPPSLTGMPCASSQIVFEQKRRCGFEDLGELATVEGRVRGTTTHADGDRSIDVVPDPGFERLLSYKGHQNRDYLHVEFMPCERIYTDVDKPLAEVLSRFKESIPTRVRITGRWAYDGVDHRGKWRDQLDRCIGGREADPSVGWTEIHPAYTIEILD